MSRNPRNSHSPVTNDDDRMVIVSVYCLAVAHPGPVFGHDDKTHSMTGEPEAAITEEKNEEVLSQ